MEPAFFDTGLGIFTIVLAQCLLVTVLVLVSLAFLMYADRKVWAAVQMRRGPNVVGPWGLLQSFADFLKYIVKEIVVPAGADKTVFFLAPMITFVLALITWAVIPFDEGWVISDMNVGILFIFAISSLHVYGVIMGGWASNSKYPFLGCLRSAAQMISYEVSLGLIIVGVLISAGSLNLTQIVMAQDGGWARSAGSGCRICRWCSCSSSRRWRRPTGRRSTCRRRNRSSWPAIRSSIPRRRSCCS
jgi:NADH-quinone oxidoreductase subunit H